jgi:uncharacterized protein (TIGR02391 family)
VIIFDMKYQGFGFVIKVTDSFSEARDIYSSNVASAEVEKISGNRFHPVITKGCSDLLDTGHYSEAAEKGFKIVRDRLRALTGFETGSDAFGKGKLYIKGAAAINVDGDFNKAIQFMTMAIDNFRNEKAHTSQAFIDSYDKAYEYLALSSLAMRHLDNGVINQNGKAE